ncbi:MAG TPA: RteC domain-containing protein [Puia sp.]
MKKDWMIMYDAMIAEMNECLRQNHDLRTSIECCFNVGQSYSAQVQKILEDYKFPSGKDEIYFYKTVKPLFKSQLEYYNLVYHAELFKPTTNPGEMKEFWVKEHQKLDRFILDHTDFHTYYKKGATNLDEQYFLSPDQTVYYDDLIAQLLALERYDQYTQKELSKIK